MTEGTNGNGVKITTREIYDMVWDISKRLERLEARVEDIIEDQQAKIGYRQNVGGAIWGAVVTAIITLLLYFLSSGKIGG